MDFERYVTFRLGRGSVGRIVGTMLRRSFSAPTLRGFWRYWNPAYGYLLMRYVYGPLRRSVPEEVSFLLTFAACGLAHDVLVAVASGFRIVFPVVTSWFLVMALSVLAADQLGVSFGRFPPPARAALHGAFLATTLTLTVLLHGHAAR